MSPSAELPELPEGYFWRVGDRGEGRVYLESGWSSFRNGTPCVMLMRRAVETCTEHIPVYGDRWWNSHKVVSHDIRTEEREVEREVSYGVMSELALLRGETMPEFGRPRSSSGQGENATVISYSVPMNAEGIAHTAELLLERHRKAERQQEGWRREVQARDEAKEKFYGDYPPKTLSEGSAHG